MEFARHGLMFVLSSPSGAGKTTIARGLLAAEAPAMTMSVSATTRSPRAGEIDGVDHRFTDHDAFARDVAADAFLEHAVVFDNRYGTPAAPVADALGRGQDVLFDIDWQGARQLKASALADHVASCFILPPSLGELERRLRGRRTDSDAVIADRMRRAVAEIAHWNEYDYVLVNDDVARCLADVRVIVAGERLRRGRAPGLAAFVAAMVG